MKIKLPSMRRTKLVLAAALMAGTAALPLLQPGEVYAAGQVTSRSITMSDSAGGATAVTYEIKFTPATTAVLEGIAVDFCAESPIIADTCTKPSGMTVGASSISASSVTTGNGTWTGTATANSARTFLYTNGTATQSFNSSTPLTISVGGFTNPTADNATFYARILTFNDSADATAYNGNALTSGEAVDNGGIALSTTSDISVSGTVSESLTFCVSGTNAIHTTGCGAAVAPTLELGHTTGGTAKSIDASAVDTVDAFSRITTNAGSGAAVRMRNSNTSCGGLRRASDAAATCGIAAIGGTAAAVALSAGDAKFGMKVASTGGTGTLTSQAPYNGSGSNYGMDITSPENVMTTFGDTVASSTGVLSNVNSTYTFAGTAGNTTPAGIYTATMTLIATGTY